MDEQYCKNGYSGKANKKLMGLGYCYANYDNSEQLKTALSGRGVKKFKETITNETDHALIVQRPTVHIQLYSKPTTFNGP